MRYDSSALSWKIDKTNDFNHKFDNLMIQMFTLIPAASVFTGSTAILALL